MSADMRDARVSVAIRESNELRGLVASCAAAQGIVGAVVLAALAYFGVALAWLVIAAFCLTVWVLATLLCLIVRRQVAHLSYLEQVCRDMNERLVTMSFNS